MTDATHQKTAVVTGVSSGIGRAIAKSLIDDGWYVFGSVRKDTDARALKEQFGENFTALVFDVTDFSAIRQSAEIVGEALDGRTLNALVNNAGIAVAGPLRHIPLEDLHFQLDVNVFGVLRVTQSFLPMLGADPVFNGPPGRIVNMSSVAGKIASPILGPYAISKHGLEALSVSLRRELMMHGIDVIVVGPGAIKTPIWDKAEEIDAEQYKDTEYYDILLKMREMFTEVGDAGLPPEDVGALVHKILTIEKPKTRYAILKHWLTLWALPRIMPARLVDKAIARRFGFPEKAKENGS